jgi:hypothetical protein
MRTKNLFIACALCLMAFARPVAAQDNNWTLLETTTYGAGGFWEDGQKVRIDRSFKSGTFSYERKVTSGQSLAVFSSKGVFSTLKSEYAPGETISVTVSVSESGDPGAAPDQVYGRVTLLQGDPGWDKSNWSSKKIAAAGAVNGQLTSSGGSYLVSPTGFDALTLTGKAPTSGNRMAVVLSCNGMDVLYLYGREGAAEQQVSDVPAQKGKDTAAKVEKDETTAGTEETVANNDKPAREKPVREKPVKEKKEGEDKAFELQPLAPRIKLLVLGALLLAAIFDLLYMFSKPKK